MKKALKLSAVIAIATVIALAFTSCPASGTGTPALTETVPIPVTLTGLTANGSETQTSTQLTLTFSRAITGLTADDVTLSGVSDISKGTLSGSGPTYTLEIDGFTATGTLSVAVAKSGYNISGSPGTVTIYHYTPLPYTPLTDVTFNTVTADGSATKTTTQLTLTFSQAVTGLTANDITLSGVSGVSKGTFSGSGPTYTLKISGFTSTGTLSVAVGSPAGYNVSGSPRTVTIYRYTSSGGGGGGGSGGGGGGGGNSGTQTPIAGDYTISGTGTFTYDGSARTVTVTAKSGKSTGTVTVKYNNSTIAPSAVGTYTVTFDVAAVTGWNAASGLSAGTLTINGLVEMVYIPSGSFQMGDVKNEGVSLEKPVHTVTLSGFYMSKYQVTQAQYQAVMGTNPSSFSSNPASEEVQGNRPVENVTWYNAVEFCNNLSIQEGLQTVYTITSGTVTADWGKNGYRLPTEAQWEYAAKGGNGSPGNYTYSGSNTVGDVAWYSENSDSKTHEVGKKAPNGLGIYDMSGNVWEWCWDWLSESYSSEAQTNPVGTAVGSYRVNRGGSFDSGDSFTRSARRGAAFPYDRFNGTGFRLVRLQIPPIDVSFNSVTATGSPTTTSLTLTFSQAITGLAAGDITLSGVSGVIKGNLIGSGPVYTLPISGFTSSGSLSVAVAKSGYNVSGSPKSVNIFNVTGTITFVQIADAAPSITGPTIYRVSNGGPTSATLTVDNPAQYDSISWRVDNTGVTGTGPSFTLSAANTAYNFIGEHFVTVTVRKGGAPYNKTVSFRVEY